MYVFCQINVARGMFAKDLTNYYDTKLDFFFSANSLKQQSAGRHVAPPLSDSSSYSFIFVSEHHPMIIHVQLQTILISMFVLMPLSTILLIS
jgi:hypothetical protein